MTRLALATCRDEPQLFRDEAPFVEALQRRSVVADACIWDDTAVDWGEYDAVVIRNTWDYHHQAQAFEGWLSVLEQQGTQIINPPQLLRWNMNKRYLQVLAEAGVEIVPTFFAEANPPSLTEILETQGWSQAVVKPMVGASGDDTSRVQLGEAAAQQTAFAHLANGTGALVQPFMPQIHAGEWSLIFFNGVYSHAVLKQPADGSFFVHEERGGTTRPAIASPETIATATQIMHHVAAITGLQPTYARVDGLLVDEHFVLMELECVEPELFLLHHPAAGDTFASAVLQAL